MAANDQPKPVDSCELREVVTLKDAPSLSGDDEFEEEAFQRHSRSLIRKLDFTLMPIIWTLYMLNYLDRNNIRYPHSPPPQPTRRVLTHALVRLDWTASKRT